MTELDPGPVAPSPAPACVLSCLGEAPPTDEETEEGRRQGTAYAAALAAVFTVGFMLFDLSQELYEGAAVNGLAGLVYLLCARSLWRPCGMIVRHVLMGSVLVHLMVLSVHVIGPDFGAHYFLMALAMVGTLLFRGPQAHWRIFYFVVAMAGLAVVELGMVSPPQSMSQGRVNPEAMRVTCLILTTVISVLVLRRHLDMLDGAREALRMEHDRSEELLLNILPGSIAERLKAGESVADSFEEVTVLFADIVAFTPMAAGTPAVRLVQILGEIFGAFDELAERHGLEKIKTIGDAYMVAGGLPELSEDHVLAVSSMGLSMLDWMEAYRARTGLRIGLRIGIHTGPVVAGVIGSKKFIYDLWGDTVNLASRMESHGVRDRVQISEAVHARLEGSLPTEARGAIEIKGRGEMHTYLLSQPNPAPSQPRGAMAR